MTTRGGGGSNVDEGGRKLFESFHRDFVSTSSRNVHSPTMGSLSLSFSVSVSLSFFLSLPRSCARVENTWLHRVFSVGNRILRRSSIYHILKFREVRNTSRGNSAKSEKSCIAMRGERARFRRPKHVARYAVMAVISLDDVFRNEQSSCQITR